MTSIPNNKNGREDEGQPNADRRRFIQGAAAAGALGAVTMMPALAEPQPPQQEVEDPKPPAGLGPHAQLDARFPMSYETSVTEGVRVLTTFFAAQSRRDLRGMARMLHFPLGTFEGSEAVVVESEDEFMTKTPASMNLSEHPERFTDHDSFLQPGCYDSFEGLEVFGSDPIRTNLSMTYARYNSSGNKLLVCQGIYCVTNNDGKWAIELMSTIFTPSIIFGPVYQDGVTASIRSRVNHDMSYDVSDKGIDATTPQLGRTLSIPGSSWSASPGGKAMDSYKVKGIKSRLQIRNTTPEDLAKMKPSANPMSDYNSYRALWNQIGIGPWGGIYGLHPYTRALHTTYDKVHMFNGIARFTAGGEEMDQNYDLQVFTYRQNRWGLAGLLASMSRHDRANDVRT